MDSNQPLTLKLTVRNAAALDNGSPLSLLVDRRDASIGRAGSTDWPLPDPERHISSRHCNIVFRDAGYDLVDSSTNGTFVNGSDQRLTGPHRLRSGDVIQVGKFEIVAELVASGAAGVTAEPPAEAARAVAPPPAPLQHAAEPSAAEPPPAAASQREQMWTTFELSNAVDWARGGFGASTPPPPVAPEPAAEAGAPAGQAPAAEAEHAQAAPLDALLQGLELDRSQLKQDDAATLRQAGRLLRLVIAGMVVMLEARARAKSQMGAQSTGLEIEGNNPLKFARSPEQAVQYMLNPQERGFMPAERAIEDSFRDLQAHQLATLRAMQGALRATLDRFSPKSIRARADTRGLLARLLPGSRDAALWKAYETEFSGVAFDSDEAFMDMFAKQFRQAYDEISRQP